MTTIEELAVVLRADASSYSSTMRGGIELLETMDLTARKTADQLERASKAWAAPQSAEDFIRSEQALRESILRHREELEKQALRDRLFRMEEEAEAEWALAQEKEAARKQMMDAQDDAEFAAWRLLERRALEEKRVVAETQSLQDQLFRKTRSRYEVQLLDLQRFYSQQRQLHQANAKQLALVDQLYFLDWRKIEAEKQAETAMMLFGRRGLVTRGARTLLPMAGMAVGGQIGSLAMMASMGAGVGLGFAGITVAAMTIKEVLDRVKLLRDIQTKYNEELRKTAQGWKDVSNAMVPNTDFGRTIQSAMREQFESIRQTKEEMKKELDPSSWWSVAKMAVYAQMFGGKMAYGPLLVMAEQVKRQKEMLSRMKEVDEQQFALQLTRNRRDRWANAEAAKIGAEYDGPVRRRMQFEFDIAEKRRKLDRENADRVRNFQTTMDLERRTLFENERRDPGSVDFGEFITRRNNKRYAIEQEAIDARLALQEEERQRRIGLARQEESDLRKEIEAGIVARINYEQIGYARQLLLLRERHRVEREEYTRQGRDLYQLRQRQGYEEGLLVKEHTQEIQDAWDRLNQRIDIANRAITPTMAEWVALAKQLKEQFGFADNVIKQWREKFDEAIRAEANRTVADQIEELNIQLDLATGKITELDAILRRLRLANPEADRQLVDQLGALQQKADLANWAKAEREKVLPAQALKKYREKLEDALKAGFLNEGDVAKLMQQAMGVGGRSSTGRFESFRPFYVDTKALAPHDPVAAGLRQNADVLRKIDEKLAVIVRRENLN